MSFLLALNESKKSAEDSVASDITEKVFEKEIHEMNSLNMIMHIEGLREKSFVDAKEKKEENKIKMKNTDEQEKEENGEEEEEGEKGGSIKNSFMKIFQKKKKKKKKKTKKLKEHNINNIYDSNCLLTKPDNVDADKYYLSFNELKKENNENVNEENYSSNDKQKDINDSKNIVKNEDSMNKEQIKDNMKRKKKKIKLSSYDTNSMENVKIKKYDSNEINNMDETNNIIYKKKKKNDSKDKKLKSKRFKNLKKKITSPKFTMSTKMKNKKNGNMNEDNFNFDPDDDLKKEIEKIKIDIERIKNKGNIKRMYDDLKYILLFQNEIVGIIIEDIRKNKVRTKYEMLEDSTVKDDVNKVILNHITFDLLKFKYINTKLKELILCVYDTKKFNGLVKRIVSNKAHEMRKIVDKNGELTVAKSMLSFLYKQLKYCIEDEIQCYYSEVKKLNDDIHNIKRNVMNIISKSINDVCTMPDPYQIYDMGDKINRNKDTKENDNLNDMKDDQQIIYEQNFVEYERKQQMICPDYSSDLNLFFSLYDNIHIERKKYIKNKRVMFKNYCIDSDNDDDDHNDNNNINHNVNIYGNMKNKKASTYKVNNNILDKGAQFVTSSKNINEAYIPNNANKSIRSIVSENYLTPFNMSQNRHKTVDVIYSDRNSNYYINKNYEKTSNINNNIPLNVKFINKNSTNPQYIVSNMKMKKEHYLDDLKNFYCNINIPWIGKTCTNPSSSMNKNILKRKSNNKIKRRVTDARLFYSAPDNDINNTNDTNDINNIGYGNDIENNNIFDYGDYQNSDIYNKNVYPNNESYSNYQHDSFYIPYPNELFNKDHIMYNDHNMIYDENFVYNYDYKIHDAQRNNFAQKYVHNNHMRNQMNNIYIDKDMLDGSFNKIPHIINDKDENCNDYGNYKYYNFGESHNNSLNMYHNMNDNTYTQRYTKQSNGTTVRCFKNEVNIRNKDTNKYTGFEIISSKEDIKKLENLLNDKWGSFKLFEKWIKDSSKWQWIDLKLQKEYINSNIELEKLKEEKTKYLEKCINNKIKELWCGRMKGLMNLKLCNMERKILKRFSKYHINQDIYDVVLDFERNSMCYQDLYAKFLNIEVYSKKVDFINKYNEYNEQLYAGGDYIYKYNKDKKKVNDENNKISQKKKGYVQSLIYSFNKKSQKSINNKNNVQIQKEKKYSSIMKDHTTSVQYKNDNIHNIIDITNNRANAVINKIETINNKVDINNNKKEIHTNLIENANKKNNLGDDNRIDEDTTKKDQAYDKGKKEQKKEPKQEQKREEMKKKKNIYSNGHLNNMTHIGNFSIKKNKSRFDISLPDSGRMVNSKKTSFNDSFSLFRSECNKRISDISLSSLKIKTRDINNEEYNSFEFSKIDEAEGEEYGEDGDNNDDENIEKTKRTKSNLSTFRRLFNLKRKKKDKEEKPKKSDDYPSESFISYFKRQHSSDNPNNSMIHKKESIHNLDIDNNMEDDNNKSSVVLLNNKSLSVEGYIYDNESIIIEKEVGEHLHIENMADKHISSDDINNEELYDSHSKSSINHNIYLNDINKINQIMEQKEHKDYSHNIDFIKGVKNKPCKADDKNSIKEKNNKINEKVNDLNDSYSFLNSSHSYDELNDKGVCKKNSKQLSNISDKGDNKGNDRNEHNGDYESNPENNNKNNLKNNNKSDSKSNDKSDQKNNIKKYPKNNSKIDSTNDKFKSKENNKLGYNKQGSSNRSQKSKSIMEDELKKHNFEEHVVNIRRKLSKEKMIDDNIHEGSIKNISRTKENSLSKSDVSYHSKQEGNKYEKYSNLSFFKKTDKDNKINKFFKNLGRFSFTTSKKKNNTSIQGIYTNDIILDSFSDESDSEEGHEKTYEKKNKKTYNIDSEKIYSKSFVLNSYVGKKDDISKINMSEQVDNLYSYINKLKKKKDSTEVDKTQNDESVMKDNGKKVEVKKRNEKDDEDDEDDEEDDEDDEEDDEDDEEDDEDDEEDDEDDEDDDDNDDEDDEDDDDDEQNDDDYNNNSDNTRINSKKEDNTISQNNYKHSNSNNLDHINEKKDRKNIPENDNITNNNYSNDVNRYDENKYNRANILSPRFGYSTSNNDAFKKVDQLSESNSSKDEISEYSLKDNKNSKKDKGEENNEEVQFLKEQKDDSNNIMDKKDKKKKENIKEINEETAKNKSSRSSSNSSLLENINRNMNIIDKHENPDNEYDDDDKKIIKLSDDKRDNRKISSFHSNNYDDENNKKNAKSGISRNFIEDKKRSTSIFSKKSKMREENSSNSVEIIRLSSFKSRNDMNRKKMGGNNDKDDSLSYDNISNGYLSETKKEDYSYYNYVQSILPFGMSGNKASSDSYSSNSIKEDGKE